MMVRMTMSMMNNIMRVPLPILLLCLLISSPRIHNSESQSQSQIRNQQTLNFTSLISHPYPYTSPSPSPSPSSFSLSPSHTSPSPSSFSSCSDSLNCSSCSLQSVCHWCYFPSTGVGSCHSYASPYGCTFGVSCEDAHCKRPSSSFLSYGNVQIVNGILFVIIITAIICLITATGYGVITCIKNYFPCPCSYQSKGKGKGKGKGKDKGSLIILSHLSPSHQNDKNKSKNLLPADVGIRSQNSNPIDITPFIHSNVIRIKRNAMTSKEEEEENGKGEKDTRNPHVQIIHIDNDGKDKKKDNESSYDNEEVEEDDDESVDQHDDDETPRPPVCPSFCPSFCRPLRLFSLKRILFVLFCLLYFSFSLVAIYYFPQSPSYSICNQSSDWGALIKQITTGTLKTEISLLVSIYNPNRFALVAENIFGEIIFHSETRGKQTVGKMEMERANIPKGSVEDFLVGLKVQVDFSLAMEMAHKFQQNLLLLDAKISFVSPISFLNSNFQKNLNASWTFEGLDPTNHEGENYCNAC